MSQGGYSFMRILWLFIFVVAVFDAWFAIHYADNFTEWEMNPLMRTFGVIPSVLFRLLSVSVAAILVSLAATVYKWAATAILATVHAALACWYIFIFCV